MAVAAHDPHRLVQALLVAIALVVLLVSFGSLFQE